VPAPAVRGASFIAYLGLGSNAGDRLSNLRAAVGLLDSTEGVRVLKRSSVYETEPVGEIADQRDFYNAVVQIETDLDPHELLDTCKRVELTLGRDEGGPRHGPRPIDVDLLIAGDRVVSSERLVIPHREITRRRFVLAPLLELDSDLKLPNGDPLAEARVALGVGQRVERIGPLE
jgi:2-amino-4-hydroxy-6-hydroxymethyldihydropteridine diphosphokinase